MTTRIHPVHLVTYGDRLGYIRVLRFTDPARAYTALQLQCEREELTQIEALWAMRQLAEVCREIYASESMAAAAGMDPRHTGRNARASECPMTAEHGNALVRGEAGTQARPAAVVFVLLRRLWCWLLRTEVTTDKY